MSPHTKPEIMYKISLLLESIEKLRFNQPLVNEIDRHRLQTLKHFAKECKRDIEEFDNGSEM